MSNVISIEDAKKIMGEGFIGSDELNGIDVLKLRIKPDVPDIPFTEEMLYEKKDDYLLILGVSRFDEGELVTIRNMQKIFGKDPEIMEPCFYNQDWYDKEDFIDIPIKDEWFLIRKTVFDDSRAVQPTELMKLYSFPSAIRCCYSFFTVWYVLGVKLWYHAFVWCSDTDHNGDRIYVGKYHDVDGVNKNGFSIHRHLGLRDCYGCID